MGYRDFVRRDNKVCFDTVCGIIEQLNKWDVSQSDITFHKLAVVHFATLTF